MQRIRLLLLVLLAAGASPARAQTPATDVILRTDGTEVSGRVLTITPLELRYLPPTGADTLPLAVADVFLVRYANGTREVLHPAPANAPTAPGPLPGLSETGRRTLAQRDATHGYTDHAAFWGSLGATLYGGPVFGLVAPAVIAPHRVAERNLGAPHPALLADAFYGEAYRQEAQRRKRGRAWAGYGVGTAAWVVLFASLLANAH
ncbi:hypothetical protein [Hymenobacter terricola]|uniref:hypothetical protein n=1 Tax=Hymenobacter terricola TaxID=2819236 RepID=UPI001B30BFBB|nr:hypothetical protein [Hymenobacter terricola]